MLLEVTDLWVSYGRLDALRGVSVDVDEKEVVALIGSNGAGKTTLLRTISGLCSPRAGTMHFRGQDMSMLSPDQRVALGLVHVPEGRHLFPGLSVRENLELGAHRVRDAGLRRKGWELVMDLFPPLTKLVDIAAGLLSGGEQQMVAIGRGLMGHPRLLVMDEPSLGLAPLVVETVFHAIETINQTGMAILLVEQNATKALELATRGYVLDLGQVIEKGDSASLLGSPRVAEAYLGGVLAG
ncbi:MAG: ABC transporter ATP-binding protein [Pseudomonadota bacterium]|nr:ABC transporter ATP-binding protein [Pseudomonadota bacterium]